MCNPGRALSTAVFLQPRAALPVSAMSEMVIGHLRVPTWLDRASDAPRETACSSRKGSSLEIC